MKHAKPEDTADANNRANRTLIQGLGVAVLLAISTVVLDIIGKWTHTEFLDGRSWLLFVVAAVQAVLTAAASWVQRVWEGKK